MASILLQETAHQPPNSVKRLGSMPCHCSLHIWHDGLPSYCSCGDLAPVRAPWLNPWLPLLLRGAGPTEAVVKRAKQEVKRILEESTEKAMRREGPSTGRYQIV